MQLFARGRREVSGPPTSPLARGHPLSAGTSPASHGNARPNGRARGQGDRRVPALRAPPAGAVPGRGHGRGPVHVDVKKLGRIPDGGGWRAHRRGERPATHRRIGFDYVHAVVDDHSLLVYAEVYRDEKGTIAAGVLLRAAEFFAAHGIAIREVISDNVFAYRHSTVEPRRQASVRLPPKRPQRREWRRPHRLGRRIVLAAANTTDGPMVPSSAIPAGVATIVHKTAIDAMRVTRPRPHGGRDAGRGQDAGGSLSVHLAGAASLTWQQGRTASSWPQVLSVSPRGPRWTTRQTGCPIYLRCPIVLSCKLWVCIGKCKSQRTSP